MRVANIALVLLLCGCAQDEFSLQVPDWSGTFTCEEVGPKEILCCGKTVEGMPLQHIFVGIKEGVKPSHYFAFEKKVRARGGTVTFID